MVAFLLTLGFLTYEIILLRKTGKAKSKPQVPQFKEEEEFVASDQRIIESEIPIVTNKNKFVLLALVGLLILFGTITLVGYINSKSGREKNKLTSRDIKAAAPKLTPTEIPKPTIEISATPEETLTPTATPLPTLETPVLSETSTPTLSPTIIQQLPKTGYVNNLLILFSFAGIVLFFSFLF